MAQSVDELTFEYRDETGRLVRRQVDKHVLSKGAWATVMYLYQDLDRSSGRYKAPKVAIVRYRKSNGVYRKQTSFNISSERQGRMIMEVLERWYTRSGELADAPADVEAPAEETGGPQPSPQGDVAQADAGSGLAEAPSVEESSAPEQGAAIPSPTQGFAPQAGQTQDGPVGETSGDGTTSEASDRPAEPPSTTGPGGF